MRRLVREFFSDLSSEKEEEDDDSKMAWTLIIQEEETNKILRRGSQLGRVRYLLYWEEVDARLIRDYFVDAWCIPAHS